MVRGVLGFVIGLVLWMPAFFLIVFLVSLAWPEYASHGRVWFESGVYTFEAPMSVVNATSWALAALFAGWVAVAVARRPQAAWALAAVLAVYLGFLHLYLYWPNFPWWYNVAVAGLAAPAVLLGSKLARPARRRSLVIIQ